MKFHFYTGMNFNLYHYCYIMSSLCFIYAYFVYKKFNSGYWFIVYCVAGVLFAFTGLLDVIRGLFK